MRNKTVPWLTEWFSLYGVGIIGFCLIGWLIVHCKNHQARQIAKEINSANTGPELQQIMKPEPPTPIGEMLFEGNHEDHRSGPTTCPICKRWKKEIGSLGRWPDFPNARP